MIKEKIKEYKKELILQIASEFLEKAGYKEAKMAQIAKHCGISIGALYKLFNSKEDLFYAYVQYQIDRFYEKLQQRFKELEDPANRLKIFIAMKFEIFMSKRKLLEDTIAGDPLFFAKLSANKENPAKKIYELVAKELEKMGYKEPLKLSYTLNYLLYGYIEYWLVNENVDLLDFVQEAYTLFTKGAENV